MSDAQAWNPESDEYISISKMEYDLKEELGEYPVTFSTAAGTSVQADASSWSISHLSRMSSANEAVMAFNFFKTVDEITESQLRWIPISRRGPTPQGWKLSDEEQSCRHQRRL